MQKRDLQVQQVAGKAAAAASVKRSDVDPATTWDLSPLFASDEGLGKRLKKHQTLP